VLALVAGGIVVVLLLLGNGGSLFGREPFTGPTWTVIKKRLRITIVERGSLESAKNGDIYCTVRSGTKGSTSASTIRWLIDNGAEVKKGDKVMDLDSSGFQEQLKDQNKIVDQAQAAKIQADENCHIQKSQNESDIEAAKNALDLAKLDLEKYRDGDYIQALEMVKGQIETARSDVESWADRSAWSKRMVKKGLMQKVQADADESKLDGAKITLRQFEEAKRVLEVYTKKRTEQDLQAKVAEATRALDRVKLQARSKLAQAEADRKSKDSVYSQELTRKREIEAEIAKCRVVAPQDGLVVYYVPEQVRGGGGQQQSIVAQGEPVREGQKMLQIPDLTKMVVNVRVHEAMVSRLQNEPDPDDPGTWQHAQIRVDAFPNAVLKGHIKTVATVASVQDWFAADVKLYQTMVSIDQSMEGLKPGMSAEVTIVADESPTEVLIVPIQSVVGSISSGARRQVFVLGADNVPRPREIVVGRSNQREVEVKEGLKEGDKIVLNPQPLLAADSELKPGKVRVKGEDNGHGGPGDEGGKKGKKGGKKGPPGGPPVGPGKGPVVQGPGGAPSQEQIQQFREMMRTATPQQRRDMLNRIPDPAKRDQARQKLRQDGLEVAD
jgi:multidrug resistance efflux pump